MSNQVYLVYYADILLGVFTSNKRAEEYIKNLVIRDWSMEGAYITEQVLNVGDM